MVSRQMVDSHRDVSEVYGGLFKLFVLNSNHYIFNYTVTNRLEYLLQIPLLRKLLSIDFGMMILLRDELLSK